MVGATGAQGAQFFSPLRPGEGQGIVIVGVMSNDSAVRGNRAAQCGKYLNGDRLTIWNSRMLDSAKENALLRLVPKDELTHLINRVDAVQVALALCGAPGEQAVAS